MHYEWEHQKGTTLSPFPAPDISCMLIKAVTTWRLQTVPKKNYIFSRELLNLLSVLKDEGEKDEEEEKRGRKKRRENIFLFNSCNFRKKIADRSKPNVSSHWHEGLRMANHSTCVSQNEIRKVNSEWHTLKIWT